MSAARGELEPSWGRRLDGIDGLRALAATAVLVFHVGGAFPQEPFAPGGLMATRIVPNGIHGLTLFFALSGFLLWRPWAASVLQEGPAPSSRRFLRHRALRILPAYAVILTVVSLAGAALVGEATLARTGRPGLPQFLADLGLVHMYVPAWVNGGIGPAWSLAVELVFYAVLPLAGLACARVARGRPRAVRLAACFAPAAAAWAVGVVGKGVAVALLAGVPAGRRPTGWDAVLEHSAPVQLDRFAFGMGAGVAALALAGSAPQRVARVRLAAGAAAVAVGAGLLAFPHAGRARSFAFDDLFALACGLVLLFVVLPAPRRAPIRVLRLRPVAWLGRISFSVYLWHLPVAYVVRNGRLGLGEPGDLALVAAVTLALSATTYTLVERPAMRLGRVPARRAAAKRAELRPAATP